MTRSLIIGSVALTAGLWVGSTAAYAQAARIPTCGIETWSTADMNYVTVPCSGDQVRSGAAASPQSKAAPCGPETWSTDKMTYVTMPCPPGITPENPGAPQ